LLLKLRAQAHDNRRHVATRDKSWFYYEYVRDRIWTAWDEHTHEVEDGIRALRKSALTALWDLHSFHIVTMPPPRASFNGSRFFDRDLIPLLEKLFPAGWSAGRRKPGVYLDSAPAHNSRMTHSLVGHISLKTLMCNITRLFSNVYERYVPIVKLMYFKYQLP
jgi:hypothetical protein